MASHGWVSRTLGVLCPSAPPAGNGNRSPRPPPDGAPPGRRSAHRRSPPRGNTSASLFVGVVVQDYWIRSVTDDGAVRAMAAVTTHAGGQARRRPPPAPPATAARG